MAQLRVLLVRSDINMAGPGKLMISNAEALRDHGVHVAFATSGGTLVKQVEAAGFPHKLIPSLAVDRRGVRDVLSSVRDLRRLLRLGDFDIAHSYNAMAGLAAFIAGGGRVRVVNTVLGNGKESWLRRMPFPVIAVSRSVQAKLRNFGVPASRIHTIPNATLDDEFFVDEARLLSRPLHGQELHLVSVAMFTGQKGHDQVLEALAAYRDQGLRPNLKLAFVGDGDSRSRIEAKVYDLKLEGCVRFLGTLADVRPALDAADLFIHLPEMETFGIVAAEAAARGLPSIVANVGGLPEVVPDGEAGLLVNAFDPDEVSAAIHRIGNDGELRKRLAHGAWQHARSEFRQEVSGRLLAQLYAAELAR